MLVGSFVRCAASFRLRRGRSPRPAAHSGRNGKKRIAGAPAVGTVTGPGGTSGTYPRKRITPLATLGILQRMRLKSATPIASKKATKAPTEPPSGKARKRSRPQYAWSAAGVTSTCPCGMLLEAIKPNRIAPTSTNKMPRRGGQISAKRSRDGVGAEQRRPSQDGRAMERVIQPKAANTPGIKKHPMYEAVRESPNKAILTCLFHHSQRAITQCS